MSMEKLQATTGEVPEEVKEGENQVDQKPPKERLE
jgi:hypothetical protein